MKYTWLELIFADRWRWVRRRAKAFWVRELPSKTWVKFYQHEVDLLESIGVDFNEFKKPGFECEDYMGESK